MIYNSKYNFICNFILEIYIRNIYKDISRRIHRYVILKYAVHEIINRYQKFCHELYINFNVNFNVR